MPGYWIYRRYSSRVKFHHFLVIALLLRAYVKQNHGKQNGMVASGHRAIILKESKKMRRFRYNYIAGFLLISLISAFAGNSILPPIVEELIIAGVKHSESLLKSGTGRIRVYGSGYFGKKKKVEVLKSGKKRYYVMELQFAFCGEHTYIKYLDPQFGGIIFDGRNQINISPQGDYTSVTSKYTFLPSMDPRDWGIWYKRQKLSDFLMRCKEKGKIRIVGAEKVRNVPCYVVETEDPSVQGGILRFWIAPKGGFRCVQILRRSGSEVIVRRIRWRRYKLKDGESVWFPEKGVMILKRGKDRYRSEMEVMDFQPNVDVTSLFDLQIPPDAKVWNVDLRRWFTFKELGWRGIEKR